MRKYLLGVLLGLIVFPNTIHSSSFLMGVVAGAALSGSDGVSGGVSGDILYSAPRINERIANPLEMRIIATHSNSFANEKDPAYTLAGETIEEIFTKMVPHPNDYIILQVRRVISPSDIHFASLWFSYIEKEKIIPLEKLPPVKKKK